MKLAEIEKKAAMSGIKDAWKYAKKDLVKMIQRKEGNFDCFGSAGNYCDQAACLWRNDCLASK